MFKQFSNLYYPPDTLIDSGKGVLPSKGMDKDDTIKFLGEDDEKEIIPLDDKTDKKSKEKEAKEPEKADETNKDDKEKDEDEEPDELKELEDELDEPDDEKLELVTPVRRKEILAKYPKLFKDFPYLEKAYYREQQFTELLPTIADAKEAVSKSEILDRFDKDLLDGNTENILLAAKESDPKAFNKIVDNYLITLAKVDEKAYHHVIGNTLKHTIVAMVTEARASQNEALQSAAQILNQFVFGKSTFENPTKLSNDNDDKKDDKNAELTERERKFNEQRFESANENLSTRVNNAYKATIEANIDPKESMSEYVRRNASREALESLESLISTDTRFKILVDKLWEKAAESNFSKESMDRIKSAFISKARTLLPSVIKKARNEALKGMGKRVSDKDEENDSKESKKEDKEPVSRSRSDKEKIPRGMSTLDFLMQD